MAKGPLPQPGEPIQLGDFLLGDYRHPAVYFLHDEDEIVYVGQSTTLRWRIETHLGQGLKTFDAVSFIPCCVSRLLEIEAAYIRKLVPKYNQCTVSKSARTEASYMPDRIRVRLVDGVPHVSSIGLAFMMGCNRTYAKQMIAMTKKESMSFADALFCAAHHRPTGIPEAQPGYQA